ncbi:MAG: DUF5700 domain-containing putative Zn-dependent protease [Candidatus Paceibacterota bacterium]
MEKVANLTQKENINLSKLSFNFCDDTFIEEYFISRIREMEDKYQWIEKNREKLMAHKNEVDDLIKNGLIQDGNIETIWQYRLDRYKKDHERVLKVKSYLESNIEYIRENVAKKLSIFFSVFDLKKTNVNFTINKKADFCVERDIIVDLVRLGVKNNPLQDAINGITHESFHVWMGEKSDWRDSNIDEKSDLDIKNQIVFRMIDEGLAVLVGGQSLGEHYERQGKKYEDCIQESFSTFNILLNEQNLKESYKKGDGFKNMGYCYVVGNEICKTILNKEGIENFKKLILETKENLQKLIELYQEICNSNEKLPKIEI